MLNPDHEERPQGARDGRDDVKINEIRNFSSFANKKVFSHAINDKLYQCQSIETFHDIQHMLIATGSSTGHFNKGRDGAIDTGIVIDPDRPEDDRRAGPMADTSYAAVSCSEHRVRYAY